MASVSDIQPLERPAITDCWNRIGVRGDRSCPELVKYVHCRNCPVHTAAASRLLDIAPPPGYLDEWTGYFSNEKSVEKEHTRAVLIFRLGREWLALPADAFKEIAPLRPVHSLPHRRDGVVSGLVNVRGELLVCVALAGVLGVEPVVAEEKGAAKRVLHPRLLVISRKSERVVFLADEVHGIHRFAPGELQEVPASLARMSAAFTASMLMWEGRAVGCLDETKLWQTLNRSLS